MLRVSALLRGHCSLSLASYLLLGLALLGLALVAPGAASALSYTGSSSQFGGGFSPSDAPYGGFGGAPSCTVTRTPVVFIHGNGDEAKNWDFPPSTGVASAYDAFRAAGYSDCELFGINWLSSGERALPQLNFHNATDALRIAQFLRDVLSYTGSSQVDVIAHSMGVTQAIHGLDLDGLWGSVRRFVSIGAALRGLPICWWVGSANPAATTCGSQNIFNTQIFGFYPHSFSSWNPRMGNGGFRDRPAGKSTLFYSLRADIHDQVLCGTASSVAGCGDSSRFDGAPNVESQLDVGYGTPATGLDFDLEDWSPWNAGGGDVDGVGHFRSKNNTGAIQVRFLTTRCAGTGCCSGYGDVCS